MYSSQRIKRTIQQGTGSARQGTSRAPHMRGGGRAFPPHMRDHSFKLPKKVRKMGLKHALSAKMKEGKLFVVDDLGADSPKTKVNQRSLLNCINL